MQEVEEIGDRWSQAFDVQAINGVDSRDNLFSGITARAMIQQPAKSALVRWVFIDVRDAQFWLPKKRMIRTFEYRSEEHTSELQSLMRISSAVFCLTKQKTTNTKTHHTKHTTHTHI